jgi:hypothetical protein
MGELEQPGDDALDGALDGARVAAFCSYLVNMPAK